MITEESPIAIVRGVHSGTAVPAFLVSRVLVVVSLVSAYSMRQRGFPLRALALRDGRWYEFIARHWYGPQPAISRQTTWPFFPLLPGLARLGLFLHLDSRVTMVVASNGAFFVALVGVHRLALATRGPVVARCAVWVTALFPASTAFSMAYPDALFLAACVWAFVTVDRGRLGAAAALGAVAAISRPNGIILALALAVAVLSHEAQNGYRSADERFRDMSGAACRVAVVVSFPLAAAATWCGWLWYRTGDPLIFLHAKSAWNEVTVVDLVRRVHVHAWPHVVLAVAVFVALFVERRRAPVSWTIFAALWLLPSLGLGIVGLGRYANECFPAMFAIAAILARSQRRSATAYLAVSVGGLVLFSVLVGGYRFVP